MEEMASVKHRARAANITMHFGIIFGICVSELPAGHPGKKYKGRFVFRGNDVRDQNWEHAIFQELGSSPGSRQVG